MYTSGNLLQVRVWLEGGERESRAAVVSSSRFGASPVSVSEGVSLWVLSWDSAWGGSSYSTSLLMAASGWPQPLRRVARSDIESWNRRSFRTSLVVLYSWTLVAWRAAVAASATVEAGGGLGSG